MSNDTNPDLVKVSKDQLITALKLNKEIHVQQVLESRAKYREMVVAELDQRLSEAKAGGDIDPGFLHKLPIPRDFSNEYDRAIDRFTWHTEPYVYLDTQDFNRFVRNEWEWHREFVASSSMYLSK